MLDLLGLKESDLRPRPDGDAKSPNATNYDESKANVYPNLPDPLVMKNGKRVETNPEWISRQKEIREDFEREVLGRMPVSQPGVEWQIVSTTKEKYGGIDVITKRLSGRVAARMNSPIKVPWIDLLLTNPANAKAPVPIIMELALREKTSRAQPATPSTTMFRVRGAWMESRLCSEAGDSRF